MQPIIGLDFGNFNTYTCFISDFDLGTRMGGTVRDLLPPRLPDGIPSVYFYSKRVGNTLLGENAVKSKAIPVQNRLRYLKRHLGETITLDGKEISYDNVITQVVQHCVRAANSQLQKGWQVTTNLISLSYPATYTFAQRQRLIELVEKATLEDGTKLKVFGTIAEPAAAALDYLSEYAKSDQDTTVLTYDLGGGTFDLGLVSVYPKGKKSAAGNTYYYDIISTRGLPKLGGAEFDEVMFKLLASKIKVPLTENTTGLLRNLAETTKVELSTSPEEAPQLWVGDDYLKMEVTRDEFERASRELVMKTIRETKAILQEHPKQKPEVILLTGGASQMPMIQRILKEELPEYKDKIVYFRPSRAIAYGAARFGTSEKNEDPMAAGVGIVQQRVMYDIGIRYYHSAEDKKGYVVTLISAGSEIPCKAVPRVSYTLHKDQRYSHLAVYEAKTPHPNNENVDQDWREIMYVEVDHERGVPVGTGSEAQLNIDKLGVITIEARSLVSPDKPIMKNHVQLKNLS